MMRSVCSLPGRFLIRLLHHKLSFPVPFVSAFPVRTLSEAQASTAGCRIAFQASEAMCLETREKPEFFNPSLFKITIKTIHCHARFLKTIGSRKKGKEKRHRISACISRGYGVLFVSPAAAPTSFGFSSSKSPRAPFLNSLSIVPKLRPNSGSLLGPNNINAAITSNSKWVGRNKFSSTNITSLGYLF